VPTVSRTRTVAAAPEEVWGVVSDPQRLPHWWPGVQRVEEASPEAWTNVLSSERGRSVRADYTLLESEAPSRLLWRHEVEESPFERILSQSLTEVALAPDDGATAVRLTVRHKPRGLARFGFLQMRLAAARQIEAALDGLEALLARQGG
jgi:uncharacterized protein YndB with AHSA1/START domain